MQTQTLLLLNPLVLRKFLFIFVIFICEPDYSFTHQAKRLYDDLLSDCKLVITKTFIDPFY